MNDLFDDLRDGRLLIRLLEIISGEKVGPSSQGTHHLNKIDNASKALEFLDRKKVYAKHIVFFLYLKVSLTLYYEFPSCMECIITEINKYWLDMATVYTSINLQFDSSP